MSLIDGGKGIFHHTYIDNLVDAILLAMTTKQAVGCSFDITDGDATITWKHYFNDLAQLAGKPPITQTIPMPLASLLSRLMMIRYHLTKKPPLLSPTAVHIFANTTKISIHHAQHLLGYQPKIEYSTALDRIAAWLQKENLI